MILALGLCEYRPALPFLLELSRRDLEHTTIYYGLGDAILRIGRKSQNDVKPIFDALKTKRFELVYGALQAMAMLRMVPSDTEIKELIRIAELPEAVSAVMGYPDDECGLRKWVAAAAAGWPPRIVGEFLKRCLDGSTDDNLQLAAEQSLKGKYVKWSPY